MRTKKTKTTEAVQPQNTAPQPAASQLPPAPQTNAPSA